MADEQKELSWEEQQQAERDAEYRRQAQIQLDVAETRAEAKKAKDLGSMTDEELRRYTRKLAGYDAI